MRYKIFLFSLIVLFSVIFYTENIYSADLETVSPDGKIKIVFKLDNEGKPLYSISYDGTNFIKWSGLGLVLNPGGELVSGFKIITADRKTIDETYRIYSGKSKYSRNYCNETKIALKEKKSDGRIIDIYLRAYNDGAAFRYGLPSQPGISDFIISSEETFFNFAGDYQCWAMKKERLRHSYEGEYKKYNVSTFNNSPGDSTSAFKYITLPVTIKINDNFFAALTEADITNYPGMHLIKSEGLSLKSFLAPDTLHKNISVRGNTPAVCPWRLFIIGNKPGKLIESNLIMNLNDSCVIPDAGNWILPGKSTWSWWAEDRGFDPSFGYQILSTKTVKYYIDFAAANSFSYVTLDGGWYGWFDATRDDAVHDITKTLPELDLPDVASYAASKGIGIILWVVWYELERQLTQALDYYQSLGIRGIKMDFMDRDDQFMTGFYRTVAEECAKRKMIVTYHGAYKPDGLSRTFPNILTYEGVMGNENARWITGFPNPNHNVMLAFTRLIAGPMDYTPGSMTNSTDADFVGQWRHPMTKGTRAQQLAMTVVYESGIQSLCESPKIYEKLPEFEFLKKVPAAWDSTIVLDGKIGEYIIIARKKDNVWYIGGMTDWNERNIKIDLGFLGEGLYSARIFSDASDADKFPGKVTITNLEVRSTNKLALKFAKGGGAAIILSKITR